MVKKKKKGFLIGFISFITSWLIMFGIYNVLSTFVEDILIKYGVFNVYYQFGIIILIGVMLAFIFGFSLRGIFGNI